MLPLMMMLGNLGCSADDVRFQRSGTVFLGRYKYRNVWPLPPWPLSPCRLAHCGVSGKCGRQAFALCRSNYLQLLQQLWVQEAACTAAFARAGAPAGTGPHCGHIPEHS